MLSSDTVQRHNGNTLLEDGVLDGGRIVGRIACGFGRRIHFSCEGAKWIRNFNFWPPCVLENDDPGLETHV